MTSRATRPLCSDERVLLAWLLNADFTGREALLEQGRRAQVRCDDPPAPWKKSPYEFDVVVLEVDPGTPRYPSHRLVPVGADSKDHSSQVQVMLTLDPRTGRLFSIRVKDVTLSRSRWLDETPSPDDFGPPYPNAVVEQ